MAEQDFTMTERDANEQIVLDSNQVPMKALTYYSINGKIYQYLGQWSKNKDVRGFKLKENGRIIFKPINSPLNIVPANEEPSETDSDDNSDFERGGKIRFKRIRTKKTKRGKTRKTKRSKTRKTKRGRNRK